MGRDDHINPVDGEGLTDIPDNTPKKSGKVTFKHRFNRSMASWRKLSSGQKASLGMIMLLLLALPLGVFYSLNPRQPGLPSAGKPITPPGQGNVFGKAASFDGVTGYLDMFDSADFDPDLGFTIEAWIKPNSPEYTGYIINRQNGSENSFSLFSRSQKNTSDGSYIVINSFSVVNQGNSCALHNIFQQKQFSADEADKITSWHHVAGVIQDDGQMDIFVDGERSIINFNSITGVCERNIDVQIGARKFFNGGADGYFGGEMDEVRTSRVSRYQDNFEPGTLPFVADLDTISLYNFNGDFNDSSSLGHHAIQVGNVRFVKSTLPKEGSTPTSGNSFPVIATRNLPKGQVAVVYDAVISGSDLDIGDNLTMTISDLPPGIIYSCDGGTSQISCTLSGIPTLKGNFRVLVVLSDGAGGSDQKTLNLQIK